LYCERASYGLFAICFFSCFGILDALLSGPPSSSFLLFLFFITSEIVRWPIWFRAFFSFDTYAGPETDRDIGVIITMGEGGVRGGFLCWGLEAGVEWLREEKVNK